MNVKKVILLISRSEKRACSIYAHLKDSVELKTAEIIVCANSSVYLSMVKDVRPCLIILDMKTGSKQLQKLLFDLKASFTKFSSIPVLCLVPGISRIAYTNKCFKSGADDVVSYPINPVLLLKRAEMLYEYCLNKHFVDGLTTTITKSYEAHNESEKRFLAIFNSSSDGLVVANLYGIILNSNSALESMLDVESGSLCGQALDQLGINTAQLNDFFEKSETHQVKKYIYSINSGLPIQCSCHFIHYRGQEALLLQFISSGEKYQDLIQELSSAREHYKTLVEHIPGGVYLGTLEQPSRIIYMSPVAEELLGFSYEEYEEDPELFGRIIHRQDRENVAAQWDKFLRNQSFFSLEYRVYRGGTQCIWIHEEARVLSDEDGTPLSVQGLITEITQQKHTEWEMRKLLLAVEHSPTLIVVMDDEGRIEYANQTFYIKTGYKSVEVIGRTAGFLYPKKGEIHASFGEMKLEWEPQALRLWIWKRLHRGEIWRGETIFRKKDGSLVWVSVAVSPVGGQLGDLTNYVAVIEDINERKQSELLREDVERITRHDIKGPLNGIINIPKMMSEEKNLTEVQRSYLNMIHNGGKKILSIVNNSLDLYRIEQGAYQLDPQPVDIYALLEQVIAHYDNLLKQKELRVTVQREDCELIALEKNIHTSHYNIVSSVEEQITVNSVHILGEELLSFTMLSNLLENAIEASPREEQIVICLTIKDFVEISMKNKGVVPADIRENFFQKYITRGKRNGNGIGTYSAKLSAEVQGGDIWLQADEDTTTIKVRLPRA